MKIKNLMVILADFDPDDEIQGTWEGITVDIVPEGIYKSKNGIVLIDVDQDSQSYKEEFISGKRNA